MARNKEAAVVVLDVGEHMQDYLPHLKRAVFLLAESKLINHATHEIALVLIGSTETNNEVHSELEAQGDLDQYLHINVLQHLACADLHLLQKINSLSCGRGDSDHISGLCVALDLFKKAVLARPALGAPRLSRRVLLISTFDRQVDELDDELRRHLAEQISGANQTDQALQGVNFSLEVYGVADGLPASSPWAECQRQQNLAGLHDLLAQVSGSYKELPRAADMCSLFRMKETAPAAKNITFTIGSQLRIDVQVYKKAAKTPLPSLSMFNPPSDGSREPGAGKVSRDTEYRHPSTEQPLQPQDKVKAFRYGQQRVPVSDGATEELLLYPMQKGLELVGFTDRDNVPRWHYTSESSVVLPQKESDAVALSALVRALANTNRVAVVRMCLMREAVLAVATPLPAPPGALQQQDCLVINTLPFKDDLRRLNFRSFHNTDDSKKHLTPTPEQRSLMRKLVRSLQLKPSAMQLTSQPPASTQGASVPSTAVGGGLDGSGREQLVPEETLNPMIQRFFYFMGQRALDPYFPVPASSEDPLAAAVLDQPALEQLPEATRELLQALPTAFPVKEAEKHQGAGADAAAAAAPGADAAAAAEKPAPVLAADEGGVRLVTGVGTATPVQDFQTLLQAAGSDRELDRAFSGMQEAITSLVDTSVGPRLFGKASEALQALREAAVAQNRPARYNEYLEKLRLQYQPAKQGWWRGLLATGLGPLSDDDVAGAGLSRAAVEEYVKVHGAAEAPAAAPVNEPAAMEEDEFEGME